MAFLKKAVSSGECGFGKELRDLRELRHLTPEQLAAMTGIHALLITLFEEERIQELADPVYDERHVRRIVRELDGKEEFFLGKYRALLQSKGVTVSNDVLLRPRVRRRDFFVTSHVFVLAGFLSLVGVILGYVGWQAHLVSSPPPLHVSQPEEGGRVATSKIEIKGETEANAVVMINGEKAIVDADGKFVFRKDIAGGVTTLRIEARRRHGLPTVLERHVTYERPAVSDSGSDTLLP